MVSVEGVSPSDRRGELLAIARAEANARRPVDLLRWWEDDATVRPSQLDQRSSTAFDLLALDAADQYDVLLLSPVAPIGTSSVVAPTSQNRTLSTTRGTEVVSDPTNVLALECARRLKTAPQTPVRLCAAHQVLRLQPITSAEGVSKHFRLFALADAGPGLPDDGFEVDLGAFDWVAQILGNRRQRFISSAIGIQLLPLLSMKNAS